MALAMQKSDKITVTIPYELKEQIDSLKNEFGITMSAIYKDALQSYVENKEREKWKRAAEMMADEYKNNDELRDWIEFEEDFYND